MRVISLFLCLLLSSCVHIRGNNTRLGSDVRSKDTKVALKMPSSGVVYLTQNLTKAGKGKRNCRKARRQFIVDLRSAKSKKRVRLSKKCNSSNTKLIVSSPKIRKGKYKLFLKQRQEKYFSGRTRITGAYDNGNFDSGGNEKFTHAQAFKADSSEIKGEVHHYSGDTTDWIQVMGQKKQLTLQFKEEGKNPRARFLVYRKHGGNKSPKFVKELRTGKSFTTNLRNNDIYVKVVAKPAIDESNYKITRKDGSMSRSYAIRVIDVYPLEETSIVLLNAKAGMKESDAITVYGRRRRGGDKELGQCVITQIEDGQASCELPSQIRGNYPSYRARATVES